MTSQEFASKLTLPRAVVVDGLSKFFKIYDRPSQVLFERMFRKKLHKTFCALRDVHFEVPHGSITGIVGRNGAGKSTLLKILSGTLRASSGTVSVDGKLAAILELGTGFHPDFSGRENIYIGGMCLGMTKAEVDARIDEIISFSELGEFIDWPFKTYSSGMKSRLTFATATSIDPDILIVDEALSVGDARFQRKSFSRMEAYRRLGKTILLVTHDSNAISTFCDSAILLERGEVLETGDPKKVLLAYHHLLFGIDATRESVANNVTRRVASATSTTDTIPARPRDPENLGHLGLNNKRVVERYSTDNYDILNRLQKTEIGDGRAKIIDAGILNAELEATNTLQCGEYYWLWMRIQCICAVDNLVSGFLVKNVRGLDLYGSDSQWAKAPIPGDLSANECYDAWLQIKCNLARGTYFLTVAAADASANKFDLRYDLIEFHVMGADDAYQTSLVALEGRHGGARFSEANRLDIETVRDTGPRSENA